MKISDLNNRNYCSGAQLAQGGDDAVNSVCRMVKGRDVPSSPRKLSANASEHTVFVVILWSEVTDFLLSSRKFFSARHEFDHLEQTHLLKVANVAHRFKLV